MFCLVPSFVWHMKRHTIWGQGDSRRSSSTGEFAYSRICVHSLINFSQGTLCNGISVFHLRYSFVEADHVEENVVYDASMAQN